MAPFSATSPPCGPSPGRQQNDRLKVASLHRTFLFCGAGSFSSGGKRVRAVFCDRQQTKVQRIVSGRSRQVLHIPSCQTKEQLTLLQQYPEVKVTCRLINCTISARLTLRTWAAAVVRQDAFRKQLASYSLPQVLDRKLLIACKII